MQIKDLTKTYQTGKDNEVKALQGISLELPERGMVFLLGKSGSGKTTLLNILGGLDRATSGQIIYKNTQITELTQGELNNYRNQVCGFVFQEYNVIPELNVWENIEIALSLQGKKGTSSAVKYVLKQVELEGFESRKVFQLSGGQRQRLAIARAIVKDSEIIFADEPTGALDSETGENIFKLLKEISKQKLVIVVSHDKDFAHRFGDRVIELSDGKIIADTGKDENFTQKTETFNVTQARLPFRTVVKLGTYSFRIHPFKFCLTLLTLVISFTMFIAVLALSNSNEFLILKNTLNTGEISQINYVKTFNNGEYGLLNDSDGEFLEKYFNTRIIKLTAAEFNFDDIGDVKNNYLYYSVLPQSIAEINETVLTTFGFTLSGNLPKDNNEICLSYYTAEVLSYYANETDIQNLIGHNIVINGNNYTISGLIDTKLNYERYAGLKEVEPNLSSLHNEFYNYVNYGVHSTLYVNNLNSSLLEIGENTKEYHQFIVSADAIDFNNYNSFYIQNDDYTLQLKCYLNDEVEGISTLLSGVRTILVILASILGILSFGLLIYFIIQSVREKIQSIGILKAIGCSDFEIGKIFIIESLIFGVGVFLISALLGFAVCALMNSYFAIKLGVIVTVVSLSSIYILILFLTTIPISVLCGVGTLLSITKINILDCISALN